MQQFAGICIARIAQQCSNSQVSVLRELLNLERIITMEKIASFTINHLELLPGIYVSRKDKVGENTITTFDLRMTMPNREPVINTAELHTIEHLAATFLRNHPDYQDKIIYFGPMGCRTGNYLILNGDYESKDIVKMVTETFEFIRDFEGEIPGAQPKDCGNYLDQNLSMAKYRAKEYLDRCLYVIEEKNLIYPA
jgi:S-ribosylhomocysteine lyase